MSDHGLRLLGWFREVSGAGDASKPILYIVTGLPSEENCFVGYAGVGWDGKRKWYVHWYKEGLEVRTTGSAYSSPEEALEDFVMIRNAKSATG